MPPTVPTLADWLAWDPAERDAHLAEAAARAECSTHGDWISLARGTGHGDGELAGIPFSVKDNVDVAGFPTTAGSPLLGEAPVEVDATVVGVLRDAGAVVLGKTNLHELAFGITSNNKAFGPVRNPADPGRSAGGSSGGSAAGVALGTVPFALGTDTGGSVLIPAAFCGVVGFRPSTGRYPGDGVVNLSSTRDTTGVNAHTAADVRTVDRLITGERGGPEIPLAGLRIGLPRKRFDDLEPAVAAAIAVATATVEGLGVRLVDVDLGDDIDVAAGAGNDLTCYEAPRLLGRRVKAPLADWPDRIASPDVRALIDSMRLNPVSAEAYESARAARWRLRRAYLELFDEVDVVLFPTSPVSPPLIGQDDVITLNGRLTPTFPTVTRNVSPGTVVGLPMLSIPAGVTGTGLPVGLCLEAPPFADVRLLGVGEAIQSAFA
ncbi:amidase family protein [Actinokineospora inagensis]|uniref:amidase family protein n=1 Tax=Actinokineospora inagensis TaxID=103730 RepID=UPI00041C55C1|nr:amidase family protein [Actinokineospora inagensis]